MKTLIFSDTHLTDSFNLRKYRLLKRLIEKADKVVINGDFWDGFSTTFDRFVTSEWQRLFPLLKKKQTVYIYGNHDAKRMSDDRVGLFSNLQTEKYVLKTNPKTYVIEHGDRITPSFETRLPRWRWLVVAINTVHEVLEGLFLRLVGQRFFNWSLYGKYTRDMEKYVKDHSQKNLVLVCGHSHKAVFTPEKGFVNSGLIRHGLAQYLEIKDSKLELREERY